MTEHAEPPLVRDVNRDEFTRLWGNYIAAKARAEHAESRLAEAEWLLRGEVEQHEAFYIQSGIKSGVHERGIAVVRAFLDRSEPGASADAAPTEKEERP